MSKENKLTWFMVWEACRATEKMVPASGKGCHAVSYQGGRWNCKTGQEQESKRSVNSVL